MKHDYYYLYKPQGGGGSDKLLLVFSALNIRPPKFSLFKKAQTLGINVLYFNTVPQDWYRNGVPGIGTTSEVVAYIESLKKELKIKSLYCFGVSMGAYGALLYGALCCAKKIFVCSAEPIIGIPGGRTELARDNFLYPEYTDLRAVGLNNIVYIYGQTDPVDSIGAYIITKANSGNLVYTMPSVGHDVADRLNNKGLLLPLINDIVNDRISDPFSNLSPDNIDDETYSTICRVHALNRARDYRKILSLTEHTSPDVLSKSAFLNITRCTALYKLGMYEEARSELLAILPSYREAWEPWSILSSTLLRLKKFSLALKAIEMALSIRPAVSISLAIKASILEKLDKKEEALQFYGYALCIQPRQLAYKDKIEELERATGKNTEQITKTELMKRLLSATNYQEPINIDLNYFKS